MVTDSWHFLLFYVFWMQKKWFCCFWIWLVSLLWDDITWPCMVVVPWYWINSCVHFRLPVGNIWRLLSISPQFQLLHDIFVKPLSYCQSFCMWYTRKRKTTNTSALFLSSCILSHESPWLSFFIFLFFIYRPVKMWFKLGYCFVIWNPWNVIVLLSLTK